MRHFADFVKELRDERKVQDNCEDLYALSSQFPFGYGRFLFKDSPLFKSDKEEFNKGAREASNYFASQHETSLEPYLNQLKDNDDLLQRTYSVLGQETLSNHVEVETLNVWKKAKQQLELSRGLYNLALNRTSYSSTSNSAIEEREIGSDDDSSEGSMEGTEGEIDYIGLLKDTQSILERTERSLICNNLSKPL
jgi:hypothetical protein